MGAYYLKQSGKSVKTFGQKIATGKIKQSFVIMVTNSNVNIGLCLSTSHVIAMQSYILVNPIVDNTVTS